MSQNIEEGTYEKGGFFFVPIKTVRDLPYSEQDFYKASDGLTLDIRASEVIYYKDMIDSVREYFIGYISQSELQSINDNPIGEEIFISEGVAFTKSEELAITWKTEGSKIFEAVV